MMDRLLLRRKDQRALHRASWQTFATEYEATWEGS
nr:MAG TPA: hypothetical protein [Caudoviricetes sp.]